MEGEQVRMYAFAWLLRGLLALTLVLAGLAKLEDPAGFANQIAAFGLTPGWLGAVLAVYLPWLELVTALGLLWHRSLPAALLISGGLVAAFLGVKVTATLREIDPDCGCFGSWIQLDQGASLGVVVVMGLAVLILARCRTSSAPS